MKTFFQVIVIFLAVLVCSSAFANPTTEALGNCLVDNLNGKERKSLAKWIFFGMAAHPELKMNSVVTQEDRASMDKYMGTLITRLLVADCPDELRAAVKVDKRASERAFGFVGEIAMQELMANKHVATALNTFAQHADTGKIGKVIIGQ